MNSDFLTNLVRRGAGLFPPRTAPEVRIQPRIEPLLTAERPAKTGPETESFLADEEPQTVSQPPPRTVKSERAAPPLAESNRVREFFRSEPETLEPAGADDEQPQTIPARRRAPERPGIEAAAFVDDRVEPNVNPEPKPFARKPGEAPPFDESPDASLSRVQARQPPGALQRVKTATGEAEELLLEPETGPEAAVDRQGRGLGRERIEVVQLGQNETEDEAPVIRPANRTEAELDRRLDRAPAAAGEMTGRTVEVRIGSIEVKTRPAQTAAVPARREAPPPVEGFEAYRAVRGYFGWHRE